MDAVNPNRLAAVEMFDFLNDDERRRLAAWFEVQEFDAGRCPIKESQHGYSFYVLDEGKARVEHDGQVVGHLEPGAVFGEMAFFIGSSRRNATVVAETPIRVFVMFGTHFREMQGQMPEVAARIQHLVEERAKIDAAWVADPGAP